MEIKTVSVAGFESFKAKNISGDLTNDPVTVSHGSVSTANGIHPTPAFDFLGNDSQPQLLLQDAKETWLFPDAVVRHEFRARHEDLRIITIDGDSMEPLLSSGDRILIDSSQKVPVPPGIFVVWDGMGLVAKRVEHIPNSEPPKIIIRSINPEYQTYERTADEVNIVGRVIWTAKRL
jgi:hypothetical protein